LQSFLDLDAPFLAIPPSAKGRPREASFFAMPAMLPAFGGTAELGEADPDFFSAPLAMAITLPDMPRLCGGTAELGEADPDFFAAAAFTAGIILLIIFFNMLFSCCGRVGR
jgi:hypothetical protein